MTFIHYHHFGVTLHAHLSTVLFYFALQTINCCLQDTYVIYHQVLQWATIWSHFFTSWKKTSQKRHHKNDVAYRKMVFADTNNLWLTIYLTILVLGCEYRFNSENGKTGIFTSPNYPEDYPIETYCRYFFEGNVDERISINWTIFDLENGTQAG